MNGHSPIRNDVAMQKMLAAVAILGLISLLGCGSSAVQAAGGSVLAATITVPSGTAVTAGTCFTSGIALSGATASMGVTVTPAGDPQPSGLTFPMLFSGFVDTTGHVTVKVCKVATPSVTTSADVVLNVKLIS